VSNSQVYTEKEIKELNLAEKVVDEFGENKIKLQSVFRPAC